MKKIEDAVREKQNIALWGLGNCYKEYGNTLRTHIPVSFLCDINMDYQNKSMDGLKVRHPNDIQVEIDYIIICMKDKKSIAEAESVLKEKKMNYCLISEALAYCNLKREEQIVKEFYSELSSDDSKWDNIMRKYVGIHVAVNVCNLKCPYCYVGQTGEFKNNPILSHYPKYIRLCLSQKRLGGQCLIVICGSGETLLSDKIIEVCHELLMEGHYLHIVTNGTITNKIRELIERAGNYVSHLFFKFSFHYGELLRRDMLEVFTHNVHFVEKAGASYTIELTTDDNLVTRIDEIIEYSMENLGALPHITIARDDTDYNRPIITKLSKKQYYESWSRFDSKLFDVKWQWFGKKVSNCYAGADSLYIDLQSGSIRRCLNQPIVDNLFKDHQNVLQYNKVGEECTLSYCYNNHAYLTLGISPDIQIASFADVRDRIKNDGKHWLTKETRGFYQQKLYVNNSRK